MEASQAAIQDASRTSQRADNNYSSSSPRAPWLSYNKTLVRLQKFVVTVGVRASYNHVICCQCFKRSNILDEEPLSLPIRYPDLSPFRLS